MNKKRMFSKIVAVILSAAALVAFFLPCIIIEVSLEVNTGVSNSSTIQRVSDGISPFMAVKALIADDEQLAIAEEKYQTKVSELTAQRMRGEITSSEYESILASSPETSNYLALRFMKNEKWFQKNVNDEEVLQDFVNEMHILAYASIAVFAIALIVLVLNILKLFIDAKAVKVLAGILSVLTFVASVGFFCVPFIFQLSSSISYGQMSSRIAYLGGPHYYVAALVGVNLLIMIFTLVSIRKSKAEKAESRASKRAAKAA